MQGKIISGEELCDALLRMTNAYVDKMTQEQGGKSIPPEAATVFNTKKISQVPTASVAFDMSCLHPIAASLYELSGLCG